jgi:hypothetical protein
VAQSPKGSLRPHSHMRRGSHRGTCKSFQLFRSRGTRANRTSSPRSFVSPLSRQMSRPNRRPSTNCRLHFGNAWAREVPRWSQQAMSHAEPALQLKRGHRAQKASTMSGVTHGYSCASSLQPMMDPTRVVEDRILVFDTKSSSTHRARFSSPAAVPSATAHRARGRLCWGLVPGAPLCSLCSRRGLASGNIPSSLCASSHRPLRRVGRPLRVAEI